MIILIQKYFLMLQKYNIKNIYNLKDKNLLHYNMETLIFNIDSRSRDISIYPTHSKFKYDLSEKGSSTIKNVVEMKISSIEFPNTSHFFNYTNGNTSFKIDDVEYKLDDGNYNTDDIITALNDKTSDTIDFTINKNTGKIKITTTSTKEFDFSNNTDYQSLGSLLGFKKNTYTINGSTTAENIPNIIGENYFFLKINDYGHIENNGKKYMLKLLMISPKYEMTFESRKNYVSKIYKFKQPTNINTLDIEIVDYLNNNISLNGVQFSFTLELTIVNNNLLKKYHELSFHSGELLELMLHDNMLEFYNRENEENKKEKKNLFLSNNVGNQLLNDMNQMNLKKQNDLSSRNNLKSLNSFKFKY